MVVASEIVGRMAAVQATMNKVAAQMATLSSQVPAWTASRVMARWRAQPLSIRTR